MKTTLNPTNQITPTPIKKFLAQNPFSYPLTLGFFYREKMRAIHRVAPDLSSNNILEIGGGQGGLTALLYPNANITNLDCDRNFANAPCNQKPNVNFVCGDATALPFADNSFAAVTMFDVLEHIPDDKKAIAEALRVLKPGGYLLLSTPNENWRFPYYSFLKSICPPETAVMAEWGHVRRGYTLEELNNLIALPCQHRDWICSLTESIPHAQKYATFINPLTVLCHDIAFSNLSNRKKRIICKLISPLTWLGYYLHQSEAKGTETAYLWQQA